MIKEKLFYIFTIGSMLLINTVQVSDFKAEINEPYECLNGNITFGPSILLNRPELKDSSINRIVVSKGFIDSCIYWYRKPICFDPKYCDDCTDVLYAGPFADSIIEAAYLMDPDFFPMDSLAFNKHEPQITSIPQSKVMKEFYFQGMKIFLSTFTRCQSPCFEYSGGCFLSSYLSFFEEGKIQSSMEYNYLNHADNYRGDLISVIANDTIISLYTREQTFGFDKKMDLIIVRKSIKDLIRQLDQRKT